MFARRILGLDVGSFAAKAVELRQTLRGLEVVQLRHLPFADRSAGVAGELRELLQAHDLPLDNVVVSLAGDRISTRRLSFPFRDRRKIGPAVPFEVEGQVPFPLDDYFVDWEVVGQRKNETEVVATLAPRAEVGTLLATLHAAGLSPRIVEAEGLVLSNLSCVFELPGARLLADVGHRKTTLCLCVDGRALASRTVPVAGLALTRALARDRGVDETEAERIKLEEGVLGRPHPAATEVLDRLAREILRTVGSLESLLPGGLAGLQAVHLLGGSGRLHRLDEFLSERTGLPTQRLPLPAGELGSAFLAGGDPLLFGPAMALALRGSSRAATRMNLRQGEHGARIDYGQVLRELRPTLVLAGVALLLGVLSLGTRMMLDARRADAAERRARELVAQALPGRDAADPLAAMQAAVRSAQSRADTLGVYRGNLSALDILTEISRLVPPDLDVVFEELSIDRQVIQIKGHSPSFGSVDALRTKLAEFGPFAEITVGDITADARRGGQNFNVRISLSEDGEPS
jgi:type IV pilus assembly protein PilM